VLFNPTGFACGYLPILAEAGDLRRFRHYRQFLKFCGLDLVTQQSGQFRGAASAGMECLRARRSGSRIFKG